MSDYLDILEKIRRKNNGRYLSLASDWSFRELKRWLHTPTPSCNSLDAIDQEQFSPDPGWYDDVDLFAPFRCGKKSKEATASPADLKPFPLKDVHALAAANKIVFYERSDGKNDPRNVGMTMDEVPKFIQGLKQGDFRRFSIESNQPKADIYKRMFHSKKKNKDIRIYFKFCIAKIDGEPKLLIFSLHEDKKKNEAMFGFEDDWLLWGIDAFL